MVVAFPAWISLNDKTNNSWVRLRLHVSVFRDTELKQMKMPLRFHVAHAFVSKHFSMETVTWIFNNVFRLENGYKQELSKDHQEDTTK